MPHVVTVPTPAFLTEDGKLEVHQVPAAEDNLVWVIVCTTTKQAAIIDGPDAADALALIDERGWTLAAVLNTHTHWDHVGVNKDLAKRKRLQGVEVIGPARDAKRVPHLTRGVEEGDTVTVGAVVGRVLLTEGHIQGHVSYVFDDVVFCGDTMFGAGCGYLFGNDPNLMFDSLGRLAALDGKTRVCCAHEYTEDNLRFAWSVDRENAALKARIEQTFALRARGECSVPSTIATERATNPFLRSDVFALRNVVEQAMQRKLPTAPLTFAATRALKDRKDYRRLEDDTFPA